MFIIPLQLENFNLEFLYSYKIFLFFYKNVVLVRVTYFSLVFIS